MKINYCLANLSVLNPCHAGLIFDQGKTMVMFRSEEYRTLELCRALALESLSVCVQAFIRGSLTRIFVQKARLIAPELAQAVTTRDLDVLACTLAKADHILGNLSVVIPLRDYVRANDLLVALRASPEYLKRLRLEAWADLSIQVNFEKLFKTIHEPQFQVCVAEK